MLAACKNFIKENKILCSILLADIIGILLTFIFNSVILADELEHLRNSYLISIGYIPYRDFFEHHNPLLWIIFSPLFKILPLNVTLYFYIARFTALICSAISLYFGYLIVKRFLKSAEIFGYFVVFLFIFYPSWYCFSVFKPDVFARMFYIFVCICIFVIWKICKQENYFYALSVSLFHFYFCKLLYSAFFHLPFRQYTCFIKTKNFGTMPLFVPCFRLVFYLFACGC